MYTDKDIDEYKIIDKDIVNEYNNAYHRTIKMNSVDVKDNSYIDSGKEVNDNNPKFKVGQHVRISKYKNICAKECTPNWSEVVFMVKEVKKYSSMDIRY